MMEFRIRSLGFVLIMWFILFKVYFNDVKKIKKNRSQKKDYVNLPYKIFYFYGIS